MNYILVFLAFIIFSSCNDKVPIEAHTDSQPTELVAPGDSIEVAFQLLRFNDIISKNFPKTNILFYKSVALAEAKVYLVKLEYFEQDDKWNKDPIYNIILVEGKGSTKCYEIIPSAYIEDLSIIDATNKLIMFEYYSSPVGYSEIIIYSINGNLLYKTDEIDESDSIDLSSINLDSMKAKLMNKEKSSLLINQEEWDYCL